jgi:hypothetical protein
MPVEHIPMYGANDPKPEPHGRYVDLTQVVGYLWTDKDGLSHMLPPDEVNVVLPSSSNEYVEVPLVVYRDGERKVIGEAVIDGDRVKATIGSEAGAELLDLIFKSPGSMSFSLAPTIQKPDFEEFFPPIDHRKLRVPPKKLVLPPELLERIKDTINLGGPKLEGPKDDTYFDPHDQFKEEKDNC